MNSGKQSTNLQMTLREVSRVGEVEKNVPKLRFKGYEDAWEQRKLGEVAPVRGGFAFKSELFRVEGVPIVRISNIMSNGTVGGDFVFYDEQTPEENILLQNGSIVIAMSGATTGKVAKLSLEADKKLYQNQRVGYFLPTNAVDYNFIFSLVNSNSFKTQLNGIIIAGAQPNISSKDIDTFTFSFPALVKEQGSIGLFLIEVDNLITLHQRKYNALKSMKKTLLSKMFPKDGKDVPEIRFKEFTDAWEQRKLGDVVLSEIKGSAKAEMIGGDTPYLETNYLNGGECLFVDSENNVEADDVIILWDGSQAGTIYHGFSGALGSTFKAYKTACLGLFIFQQLKKNQQTIYDKYRTPNIPHVIKTFKDEYNIMLTSEEEQNEIGRYFQQIDNLITLHQRKLDELKNMKKTLLQQMFV